MTIEVGRSRTAGFTTHFKDNRSMTVWTMRFNGDCGQRVVSPRVRFAVRTDTMLPTKNAACARIH